VLPRNPPSFLCGRDAYDFTIPYSLGPNLDSIFPLLASWQIVYKFLLSFFTLHGCCKRVGSVAWASYGKEFLSILIYLSYPYFTLLLSISLYLGSTSRSHHAFLISMTIISERLL
jgi:hypothetical protein